MQSSNPVFTRSEGFNGRGGAAYAGFGSGPATTDYGYPSTHTEVGSGRMTIDTVVQKTAITLGVVVLAAHRTDAGLAIDAPGRGSARPLLLRHDQPFTRSGRGSRAPTTVRHPAW